MFASMNGVRDRVDSFFSTKVVKSCVISLAGFLFDSIPALVTAEQRSLTKTDVANCGSRSLYYARLYAIHALLWCVVATNEYSQFVPANVSRSCRTRRMTALRLFVRSEFFDANWSRTTDRNASTKCCDSSDADDVGESNGRGSIEDENATDTSSNAGSNNLVVHLVIDESLRFLFSVAPLSCAMIKSRSDVRFHYI